MHFIFPVYIAGPSLPNEASSSGQAMLKQKLANFPINRKNIYQLQMRTEARGGSDNHLSELLNIRAAQCSLPARSV